MRCYYVSTTIHGKARFETIGSVGVENVNLPESA